MDVEIVSYVSEEHLPQKYLKIVINIISSSVEMKSTIFFYINKFHSKGTYPKNNYFTSYSHLSF